MDRPAAIAKLESVLKLIDQHEEIAQDLKNTEFWNDPFYVESQTAVRRALPVVERIALEVDPTAAKRIADNKPQSYMPQFQSVREGIDHVLGALQGQDELDDILGPAGPRLAATHLHRWVWEPACTRWDAGQRRDAIQAAATSVFDHHLAAKLLRGPDTKGGRDLAGQAFSLQEPVPGSPRLRLPDYSTGSRSWTSAHEGAMYLGQACAQMLRNLHTHNLTEPDEDRALEMLATLSLFARVVDEAVVVTAP